MTSRASQPIKIAFVIKSIDDGLSQFEARGWVPTGSRERREHHCVDESGIGWFAEIEDMTRLPDDVEVRPIEEMPKWGPIDPPIKKE